MRSSVGMFRAVDLETSNGVMQDAREIVLLCRLFFVHGEEHSMLIIGVVICVCSC